MVDSNKSDIFPNENEKLKSLIFSSTLTSTCCHRLSLYQDKSQHEFTHTELFTKRWAAWYARKKNGGSVAMKSEQEFIRWFRERLCGEKECRTERSCSWEGGEFLWRWNTGSCGAYSFPKLKKKAWLTWTSQIMLTSHCRLYTKCLPNFIL